MGTSPQWPRHLDAYCQNTHVGYIHRVKLRTYSIRFSEVQGGNTLFNNDFLGSRTSSSLALVLHQPSYTPRTIPYELPTNAGNWASQQLSNQDPQILTLPIFAAPPFNSPRSNFQYMVFYLQSSLSSISAANSFWRTVYFSDYLTRGFLASLLPPTAIMCNYRTWRKIKGRWHLTPGQCCQDLFFSLSTPGKNKSPNSLLASCHITSGSSFYTGFTQPL